MADTRNVAAPEDLLRLMQESRIFSDEELRVAGRMVPETSSSKMLARRLVAKGLLTRWQAGQLLVGWTRLRLGNHRLCGQIGRGAYGRVFLAEHMQLEREVAIKTLSRRFTQRPEIVDRFLADARRIATLDHRNLVHVLDIDSDCDQYYMVMEYVVGRHLRELVAAEGPLSDELVVQYLVQAADGLAHAHQSGIVHGDLRPENLMLDDKGVIKILGIGVGQLAAFAQTDHDNEVPDPHGGFADFLSPEQLRGETTGDARSDLYSLGATAQFLLTGRTPAPQPTTDAAVATSTEADFPQLGPEIEPKLQKIVGQMTAADPADRFASAEDCRDALQTWLAEGIHRSVPTPPVIPNPAATTDYSPMVIGPPPSAATPVISVLVDNVMARQGSHDSASEEQARPIPSGWTRTATLPWLLAGVTLSAALVLWGIFAWWPATEGPAGPPTTAARDSQGGNQRVVIRPQLRRIACPLELKLLKRSIWGVPRTSCRRPALRSWLPRLTMSRTQRANQLPSLQRWSPWGRLAWQTRQRLQARWSVTHHLQSQQPRRACKPRRRPHPKRRRRQRTKRTRIIHRSWPETRYTICRRPSICPR